MKRIVSVIVREGNGRLAIVADRKAIECDDEHTGIDAALQAAKDGGARGVLILLEDDSVARHWTLPQGDAVTAAAPAGKAGPARAKLAAAKPKKTRKHR